MFPLLLALGVLYFTITSASLIPYTNVSIASSNYDRYYLLTFPPSFDPIAPTPVIFSFHGGNRTAEQQYHLSRMSDTYFNDFAIAVYPQGVNKTWQGIPGASTNDILFTQDILTSLSANYTVDPNRIYATGKSQGGGFCGTLACDPEMSKKIAAFAPVSGAFYIKNETKCRPETIDIPCKAARQVPIIEFHGGEDHTIDYKGKGRRHQCLPSIPHWIEEWVTRDDLEGGEEQSEIGNATLYSYGGGIVSHVFDPDIGHDWPSTLKNSDNNGSVASFNASQTIIEFFKTYSL